MKWSAILGMLCWGALIISGLLSLETNIEDLSPWLPQATPEREEYDQFLAQFGNDSVLVIAWSDISLGDTRIEEFQQFLLNAAQDDGTNTVGSTSLSGLIKDVIVAEDLIRKLQEKSQSVSREEAIQKLQPFIIGYDGKTTCLLVPLTQEGDRIRRDVVDAVLQISQKIPSIASQLRLGGRPYLGYYSSQVTRRTVVRLSIPVAILSTLLAWLCLRRFDLTILVFLSSALAALSALSVIALVGYRLNGLFTALPSLVYVVNTSASIHLVNYARQSSVGLTRDQLAAAVYRKARKPCTLSAVSTGLGTLSLVASRFPAIQEFGCFATLGILISLLIQLGLIPQWLAWLLKRSPEPSSRADHHRFQNILLGWTIRSRWLVISGTLFLMLGFTPSLLTLQGQFEVDAIFDEETDFVQDTRWLEQHLGAMDATEVVVSLEAKPAGYCMVQLDRIRELEVALQSIPGVSATYSASTMIPKVEGVFRRLFARSVLSRIRESLLESAYLDERDGREYWRITVRSSFFDQSLRSRIRPLIIAAIQDATVNWEEQPELVITGSSQIVHESQGQVLRDFINSIFLAFALILLLMGWALRSLLGGVISMIPNLFPFLSIFGMLSLVGSKIDLGMTVAACIALGIAVDDTSHLLIRFQDAQQRYSNRLRALSRAYRECSVAMLQTSIICGLSMVPYQMAPLVYLQQFGILLPLLMTTALLGDLLFLPAFIATRLGHVFCNGRSLQSPSPEVLSQDGGGQDDL